MRNVKTGDLRTQKCLKNVGILTPRRGYIINIGGILGVFLTSKKGVLFSVKKPLKSTLYTCKLNIKIIIHLIINFYFINFYLIIVSIFCLCGRRGIVVLMDRVEDGQDLRST